MSEHITHIAVYDDTVRLIRYTEKFTTAFTESLIKEYDSGFFTSGILWSIYSG